MEERVRDGEDWVRAWTGVIVMGAGSFTTTFFSGALAIGVDGKNASEASCLRLLKPPAILSQMVSRPEKNETAAGC